MKVLKMSILLATIVLGFSAQAADVTFESADNRLETQICIDVATNNLEAYKKHVSKLLMGASKLQTDNYLFIARELRCNSENIVQFAHHYQSEDIAVFMSRYSRKTATNDERAADTSNADDLLEGEEKVVLVTSVLH